MTEPIKLGVLIKELELQPQDNYLRFDFPAYPDMSVDSYRGYYSDLALGFQDRMEDFRVKGLLSTLKSCIGKTFEGYKGGDFTMDESTPVWVANWSHSTSTGVVGIIKDGNLTVLSTAYCVRWVTE